MGAVQVRKMKIMNKNAKITVKQENKGAKGVLSLTSQLSQVLKQFQGIYGAKLPECDGLTVEDYMAALGVHRFEKNGKKKGYTPAGINSAWADGLLIRNDEGKVVANQFYKARVAKYMINDEDVHKSYVVYTKEVAERIVNGKSEKGDKAIVLYEPVTIASDKWSVATILKGLRQSAHIEKHEKRHEESVEAWNEVEECYIIMDGEHGVRTMVQVRKEDVIF